MDIYIQCSCTRALYLESGFYLPVLCRLTHISCSGPDSQQEVSDERKPQKSQSELSSRNISVATPKVDQKLINAIRVDLCRTFPRREFFQVFENREKLGRILLSFGACRPQVGYCQGMNFLAGFLVALSGGLEEEAFWMFGLLFMHILQFQALYVDQVGFC